MGVKTITIEKTYKRIYEKYIGKNPNTEHKLVIESFKSFMGDKTSSIQIEGIQEVGKILTFREFMNLKEMK